MGRIDRYKTCLSCEAHVSLDATCCPFCGADQLSSSSSGETNPPSDQQDERFSSQSLQESLASLYKPPYSVRNRQGLGVPDEREEAVFTQATPKQEDPLFEASYEDSPPKQESTPKSSEEVVRVEKKGGVWPLILLSIGGNLLVLGLLLLIFSHDGKLVLEWNSRLWFVYCLSAIPFLTVGVKLLKTVISQEEEDPNP